MAIDHHEPHIQDFSGNQGVSQEVGQTDIQDLNEAGRDGQPGTFDTEIVRRNAELSTLALAGISTAEQTTPTVADTRQETTQTPRRFSRRAFIAAGAAVAAAVAGVAVLVPRHTSADEEKGSRPAAVATPAPGGEASTTAVPEATRKANSPATMEEAETTGFAPDTVLTTGSPSSNFDVLPPQPGLQTTELTWNGKKVTLQRAFAPNTYLNTGTAQEKHLTLEEVSHVAMANLSAIYSTPVGTPEYNALVAAFTKDPRVARLLHDQATTLQTKYPGDGFFMFTDSDETTPRVLLGPEKPGANGYQNPVLVIQHAWIRRINPRTGAWNGPADFLGEQTLLSGDAAKIGPLMLGCGAEKDPNKQLFYLNVTSMGIQIDTGGQRSYLADWFPISDKTSNLNGMSNY